MRLAALLLFALSMPAQSYRASVAAVASCAALDASSSVGLYEANPLLRDGSWRFSGRGVAIKAGIAGAIVGVGWIVRRRNPEARRAVAAGNWITAASWCGAAGWNVANR